MSERQFRTRRSAERSDVEDVEVSTTRADAEVDAFDGLLDDIDAVLEQNPEDYVRSFVQKGGQ